jgi:hypothetical protein
LRRKFLFDERPNSLVSFICENGHPLDRRWPCTKGILCFPMALDQAAFQWAMMGPQLSKVEAMKETRRFFAPGRLAVVTWRARFGGRRERDHRLLPALRLRCGETKQGFSFEIMDRALFCTSCCSRFGPFCFFLCVPERFHSVASRQGSILVRACALHCTTYRRG